MTREVALRHAEKFGCDRVYESAAEEAWSGAELARLKAVLRRIAEQHRKARRPRIWWETVPPISDSDVAALHAEGQIADEIAVLADTSRNAVHKALERHAATLQNGKSGMEKSHVS
jgi:hypothetical protein